MSSLIQYNDAIVSVRDKEKNVDLSSQPHTIDLLTHMYSNTKKPVPRFTLNNTVIKRNNSLLVGYMCLNCAVLNEITLNLYLRKVNKGIRCCDACKNLNDIKRAEHTAYMKGERIVEQKEVLWSEKSLKQRLDESTAEFDAKDDDFKTSYFLKHFTLQEFERVNSKIITLGQGKIKDLTNWTYFPTYKIGNQTQFTPMMLNVNTNTIEKPLYIEWKCEVCETNFINRDLEVQKNRLRILCAECSFCNRTFKVKSFTTPWGKIIYQSQQELHLIKWCISNMISIMNGPTIEYNWNGKQHKYKVDFQLPDYKFLLEIKDNHVWHKKQVESGKWGAKENCAKHWCEEKGWKYEMIFPTTLSAWKEQIIKLKS